MARRERRRAVRRKRKERSVERRQEMAAKREAMAARSEARNRAAREALEPLAPDERPTVVTVGAVISALIAVSAIIGYIAEVEVTRFGSDGIQQGQDQAPLLSIVAVVGLMGTMAWGMWNAKYWAVLGFQALLVLVLVSASIGLLSATEWVPALATTLLIAGAGAMFYFLVKALARIQMPQREPRE
jgi:hypothetical protein